MTPRETAALTLGVLGVFLLGDAVTEVGGALFYYTVDVTDEALAEVYATQGVSLAIWSVLKVGFGSGLLAFRYALASRLAPDRPIHPGSLDSTALQGALFAVVGVYFFLEGASALIGAAAQLEAAASLSDLWPHYAAPIAKTALGLFLFFSSGALAGLWHSARQVGRDRSAL